MPELPDVEVFRQYAEKHALNKEITSITWRDADQILKSSRQKISRTLKGEKFKQSKRKGKHMFLRSGSGDWLVLHFGMTGHLKYFDLQKDTPAYAKVIFRFKIKHGLACISKRKLGGISITEDPEQFSKENDLGPDALECSYNEFREALEGKRGSVKNALMDQRCISGIGNIYSDEILFREKLHPKHNFSKLEEKALKSLFNSTQAVLKKAIEKEADPSRIPKTWLLPRREEGKPCPGCGGEIKKIKVNGRGTYLCPSCQQNG